ncbi:MAG: ATP-binding protein [Myxococcales bacterium]|jgi:signal transduction histidine kinase
MSGHEEGDLKLTEERLARVSVLQELTVSALDLFDPRRSMDDLLDRLAMRLGCRAVVCLGSSERSAPRLLGASGLSRASRSSPIPAAGSIEELCLPYIELAGEGMVRWFFRVTPPEGPGDALGCVLLLYFDGEPRLPAQYHGVVERLVDILRTALLHRRLYARTLESERRLFEQKTLLECQSEASLDGILFVATDGTASYNERFREIFDLPEAVGGFADLLEPVADKTAVPADMAERMRRTALCREEQSRTEVVLHDGRSFDVACAPVKSRDGVYFGRSWYWRDISERKRVELERALLFQQEQLARAQAEEARRRASFLAEASRLLASSLDYAATLERVVQLALPNFADWSMVDVLDEDNSSHRVVVAHFDPAKAELAEALRTRFPPNEEAPAGAGRVLRDGKPELFADIDASLLRKIARTEKHFEVLQALGTRSAVIVPLTARGRQLGALSLVYGDSGRRYGEAELALAEDLACRAALAVDNARLYLRTREAVRARDEFLSIASHELRTPVTSLQLAAQGLLRLAGSGGLDAVPPAFLRTSLETSVRQSSRMAQLIDRLLDVSRIQAGRLELQLEPVDLAAVAREIVAVSREEIGLAGCELTLKADAPVVGRWDRSRLEQVTANLLSNALKYGAGKPIEIRVEAAGDFGRMIVRDQGIGIPVNRRERIFERFERAVSASHYSGLGLGLYIVQRVLQALGGSVTVESEEGAGATFVVELPFAGPPGREARGQEDHEGAA